MADVTPPDLTTLDLEFQKQLNGSIHTWNESEQWVEELDVFYRPDVVIIVLYVGVLTASLAANTLLIFIVIKFQYMRR